MIWQKFSLASGHFKKIPPSYLVGFLPYVVSIIGKEMKTNFLPVWYIRTPSEQGLTPKNTHWAKPGQAYCSQNALLGWHYPSLTCDIKVIPKVRKRRYWNIPCFPVHRTQPRMLWPLIRQGHGTKHSTCTWYSYALAKPASILVLSYKKHTVCF